MEKNNPDVKGLLDMIYLIVCEYLGAFLREFREKT